MLVIQEWWGLNEHVKDICCRLAQKGFIALAPDLYDGKFTQDPQQAGEWMQPLDRSAPSDPQSEIKLLQEKEPLYAEHIGVMGFCMGGSLALLLACREPSLKAAVPFYGDAPEPIEQLKNIRCPVLFFGAGKDQWIRLPPRQNDRLKKAFVEYGVIIIIIASASSWSVVLVVVLALHIITSPPPGLRRNTPERMFIRKAVPTTLR